ncbi:hypothetical protein RF11_05718 [Thelohanellus kitauei]|uniref:Uncharacterized protein n=1 Tax=Thelohanellus kitauei TaxID=669202 RepID=A0A0C2JPK5_THEKT|nr:hypothetical protein RF11_05718 [Thelohanellus kitauei]
MNDILLGKIHRNLKSYTLKLTVDLYNLIIQSKRHSLNSVDNPKYVRKAYSGGWSIGEISLPHLKDSRELLTYLTFHTSLTFDRRMPSGSTKTLCRKQSPIGSKFKATTYIGNPKSPLPQPAAFIVRGVTPVAHDNEILTPNLHQMEDLEVTGQYEARVHEVAFIVKASLCSHQLGSYLPTKHRYQPLRRLNPCSKVVATDANSAETIEVEG